MLNRISRFREVGLIVKSQISWSVGAEGLKRYAAEEAIGRHFSIFYSEGDRVAGVPDLARPTVSSEGRFEAEGWYLRKDGSRFWVHSVAPVPQRRSCGVRNDHA